MPRPPSDLHDRAIVGSESVVIVVALALDPVGVRGDGADRRPCWRGVHRWRVVARVGGSAGRRASSGGVGVPRGHIQEGVGGQTVGQRRGQRPDDAVGRVGGLQDDPLHLGAVADVADDAGRAGAVAVRIPP